MLRESNLEISIYAGNTHVRCTGRIECSQSAPHLSEYNFLKKFLNSNVQTPDEIETTAGIVRYLSCTFSPLSFDMPFACRRAKINDFRQNRSKNGGVRSVIKEQFYRTRILRESFPHWIFLQINRKTFRFGPENLEPADFISNQSNNWEFDKVFSLVFFSGSYF